MAKEYRIREFEYERQEWTALLSLQLETKEFPLLLYPALPEELNPVFQQALEAIEKKVPLHQIPQLQTVTAYYAQQKEIRQGFGRYLRASRKLKIEMANSTSLPRPTQIEELFNLLKTHPAVKPTSLTASDFVRDFEKYPYFAAIENWDSRFLRELETKNWTCPLWQKHFHHSLRARYTKLPPEDPVTCCHYPIFDNPPNFGFQNRAFLFTGKFEYGSRKKCQDTVKSKGAVSEANMTRKVDILVVANEATRSAPSRKIKALYELRAKGHPAILLNESQWIQSL